MARLFGTTIVLVAFCFDASNDVAQTVFADSDQFGSRIRYIDTKDGSRQIVADLRYSQVDDHQLKALLKLGKIDAIDFSYANVSDRTIEAIKEAKNIRSIALEGTFVRADGLSILTRLRDLEDLNLSRTEVSNSDLKQLKDCLGLRTLQLDYTDNLGDEGLLYIGGIRSLQSMSLARRVSPVPGERQAHSGQITAEGLACVARLPNLRRLNLSGIEITEKGFAELRFLAMLEELDIRFVSELSDRSLAHLALLQNLKRLELGVQLFGTSKVSDTGFSSSIGKLKGLRQLAICNLPLTENQIESIGRLEELRILGLHSCRIATTNKGFSGLNRLLSLDLSFTDVTDLSIANLQGSAVRHLNLTGTMVGDNGVSKLENLSGLVSLSLARTSISDRVSVSLGKLNLIDVDLSSTNTTDKVLTGLKTKQIKSINLNSTKVTDNGIALLQGLELATLDITNTDVGDDGLKRIAAIDSILELKIGNTNVTADGLKHCFRMRKLVTLAVDLETVEAFGIESIHSLKSLQWLFVSGVYQSKNGVARFERLRQALPKLRVVMFT